MANDTVIKTIDQSLQNLTALDVDKLIEISQVLVWNNLNCQDLKNGFDEIMETMNSLVRENLLNDLPFSILNTLNAHLINIHTRAISLINNSTPPNNQTNFNNLMSHVDNFRMILRQYGLYNLAKSSIDIPKLSATIQEQLSVVTEATGRIQQLEADFTLRINKLENEIKNLISPAIAGSLSKSFGDRKKFLFKMRIAFLILTAISLVFGLLYTGNVITLIITQFSADNFDKLSLAYTILRIFALLPIYLIVGFCYRQYSRERTIEENYAHKETVASILKTYGELITDNKVKDELLENVSKVIVSNPEKYKFEKQKNIGDDLNVPGLIKDLIDLIKGKDA